MFSCKFCEISKRTFLHRTPLVAASVCISGRNLVTMLIIFLFQNCPIPEAFLELGQTSMMVLFIRK